MTGRVRGSDALQKAAHLLRRGWSSPRSPQRPSWRETPGRAFCPRRCAARRALRRRRPVVRRHRRRRGDASAGRRRRGLRAARRVEHARDGPERRRRRARRSSSARARRRPAARRDVVDHVRGELRASPALLRRSTGSSCATSRPTRRARAARVECSVVATTPPPLRPPAPTGRARRCAEIWRGLSVFAPLGASRARTATRDLRRRRVLAAVGAVAAAAPPPPPPPRPPSRAGRRRRARVRGHRCASKRGGGLRSLRRCGRRRRRGDERARCRAEGSPSQPPPTPRGDGGAPPATLGARGRAAARPSPRRRGRWRREAARREARRGGLLALLRGDDLRARRPEPAEARRAAAACSPRQSLEADLRRGPRAALHVELLDRPRREERCGDARQPRCGAKSCS